jgi:hypothetical protein
MYSYFFSSSITIENSTISGNQSARNGGGLGSYSEYLPVTASLRNSTISGNTADGIGGGISAAAASNGYPTGADDILHNCTVTANTATDGGGIAHDSTASVEMNSTIVARNYDSTGPATPDLLGDVAADFSLIGDGTGGSVTGANNLVGTAASPIDPMLGPLANNGGPTQTHALLAGSPALNAGANIDGLVFDQRGSNFARVVGSAADIGAYETQNIGVHVFGSNGDEGQFAGGFISATIKVPETGIFVVAQTGDRVDQALPKAYRARFRQIDQGGIVDQLCDNSAIASYLPFSRHAYQPALPTTFDLAGESDDIADFSNWSSAMRPLKDELFGFLVGIWV